MGSNLESEMVLLRLSCSHSVQSSIFSIQRLSSPFCHEDPWFCSHSIFIFGPNFGSYKVLSSICDRSLCGNACVQNMPRVRFLHRMKALFFALAAVGRNVSCLTLCSTQRALHRLRLGSDNHCLHKIDFLSSFLFLAYTGDTPLCQVCKCVQNVRYTTSQTIHGHIEAYVLCSWNSRAQLLWSILR